MAIAKQLSKEGVEAAEAMIKESVGIDEKTMKRIQGFMDKGMVGGSIHQPFTAPLDSNGHARYTMKKTTVGVTISGNFTITEPTSGTFDVVAKDGKTVVFQKKGARPNEKMSFKYKTGWSINLQVDIQWSEKKGGTLKGNVDASY